MIFYKQETEKIELVARPGVHTVRRCCTTRQINVFYISDKTHFLASISHIQEKCNSFPLFLSNAVAVTLVNFGFFCSWFCLLPNVRYGH